jgi:hypothetical protein
MSQDLSGDLNVAAWPPQYPSLGEPVPWLALTARLESFSDLKPGCNGYSALPPSGEALSAAANFLEASRERQTLPLTVAPSAVGGVGITFRRDSRRSTNPFHAQDSESCPYLGTAARKE